MVTAITFSKIVETEEGSTATCKQFQTCLLQIRVTLSCSKVIYKLSLKLNETGWTTNKLNINMSHLHKLARISYSFFHDNES